MDRILEGDLSRFEVPDLLTFLSVGKRTGVLALERPDQETKLFLREGNPVFANSTRDGLRLGSLLVRLGRVKQEYLDRVLARLTSGYRLGHALLQDRVLKEDELASVLKVQVSEVVFDTFTWGAGVFTFFDRVLPPATAVTLDMNLQNLIMEGVRRIDERGRIQEAFPDLEMVAESITNPEHVKASVTLTPEEWQVYFLVDGRRSLKEICSIAGTPDEMATVLILFHLAQAKFIRVVASPGDSNPPSSGQTRKRALYQTTSKVAFAGAPLPRRPLDDSKNVVSPKAVQYLEASTNITVSRLVLLKDGVESSFPLTRDTYTLGRHRNNDIVVSDPKVSSFHARIDRSREGFTFVDLKSRNGSYVNGHRIDTAALKTGDEIRLGTARLVYRVDYTAGT